MLYHSSLRTIKVFLLKFILIKKLVNFLKYHYRITFTDSIEIEKFLNKCKFLAFNSETKRFRINKGDLAWPQKIAIRRLFMKDVFKISQTSITLKDLTSMHFYDRCLERYIYERRCEYKSNEETCWYHDAQNNKCVGWYDPRKSFEAEGKMDFVKEKALEIKRSGWRVANLEALVRDDDGNIFYQSSNIFEDDYKILELVGSIQKSGFSNWLSLSTPIVLGYSTTTKRFNAICGRHRIAALRHLQRQGKISSQLNIMCYIVEYPFESLAYTRPYTEKCKQCMEEA